VPGAPTVNVASPSSPGFNGLFGSLISVPETTVVGSSGFVTTPNE